MNGLEDSRIYLIEDQDCLLGFAQTVLAEELELSYGMSWHSVQELMP